MENQEKHLKYIGTDNQVHNRVTPFKDGVYIIKHPLLFLFKPRIVLRFNDKGNKIKAELRWLRKRKKLKLIKLRAEQVVFQFNVDIISVDVVINFYKQDGFTGFFDTPIGHVTFTGYALTRRRGRRR